MAMTWDEIDRIPEAIGGQRFLTLLGGNLWGIAGDRRAASPLAGALLSAIATVRHTEGVALELVAAGIKAEIRAHTGRRSYDVVDVASETKLSRALAAGVEICAEAGRRAGSRVCPDAGALLDHALATADLDGDTVTVPTAMERFIANC